MTSPSDRMPMTKAPMIVPPIVPRPPDMEVLAQDRRSDRVQLSATGGRMRGHQLRRDDEADDRRAQAWRTHVHEDLHHIDADAGYAGAARSLPPTAKICRPIGVECAT